MSAATVRKAIAAACGVVLTGVLEYVSTSTDLGPWLEQLVPRPLVPLVPIVLGGITIVGGVYRAKNVPQSGLEPTLDEPALEPALEPAAAAATPPEAITAATAAAGASVSSPAPFWQGVAAGEPAAATSLVQLLPEPARPSYQ